MTWLGPGFHEQLDAFIGAFPSLLRLAPTDRMRNRYAPSRLTTRQPCVKVSSIAKVPRTYSELLNGMLSPSPGMVLLDECAATGDAVTSGGGQSI